MGSWRKVVRTITGMGPWRPALLLAGRRRVEGSMRLIHRRRRLLLASLIFVSILVGPEGYQDGINQLEASLTGAPPPNVEPPPATVAVVHQERTGELYTAEEIDPDGIRHIQWAYNRQLGTMDRAEITVKGESVQAVRTPFGFATPPSGTALEAELDPPWVNGLSLGAGHVVNGTVPITISDFGDNVAVIRAEITVDGELVAALPHPSDPLTHSWDSTTVDPGWHDLEVTVFDAMLNEQSLAVRFFSNPAPHLPGGRAGS